MRYSGKELAERLGVAPATLSQAAKNGHRCQGHPVSEWAVRNADGRLRHYEVPEDAGLPAGGPPAETAESRANPARQEEDSHSPVPTRPDEQQLMQVGQMARAINSHNTHNTSLLPPGENYTGPVASGSAAYVLGQAIQSGGRTADAMVLVGSAGGMGALGAALAPEDRGWAGGLVGLLAGGTLSAWGLGLLSGSPEQPQEGLSGNENSRIESGPANEPAALSEAGVQAGRLLGGGAGLLAPAPGETVPV